MLGLGRLPSAPLQLSCTAANQSAVRLSWQPPAAPGHPPLHKYLLQRQRLLPHAEAGGAGGGAPYGGSCAVEERWEAAGEPDDEESSWLDAPSAAGSYRYRLAAWSAYGHSPYAVSANACTVRVAAQWQHGGGGAAAAALAPAEMQALVAAAAAAAGGNLLVPLALPAGAPAAAPAGSGATWSWSAASSTVVVGLSILLKASQLRLGAVVGAAWRSLLSWLAGRRGGGDGAGAAGAAAAQAPAAEGQLNRQSEEQQQGTGMAALGVAADGAAFPTAAAGMRRTGTSHASLHSLGSEGGEQLPAGMRVTCTAAWSSMQLEGSELDAFAAAEAAADQVAADEELQTAVLRGARCAYAGCHRRFDRLRDMRRRLEVGCRAAGLQGCRAAGLQGCRGVAWRGWRGELRYPSLPACLVTPPCPSPNRPSPPSSAPCRATTAACASACTACTTRASARMAHAAAAGWRASASAMPALPSWLRRSRQRTSV